MSRESRDVHPLREVRNDDGRQVLIVRADDSTAYVDGPRLLAHVATRDAQLAVVTALLRETRVFVPAAIVHGKLHARIALALHAQPATPVASMDDTVA